MKFSIRTLILRLLLATLFALPLAARAADGKKELVRLTYSTGWEALPAIIGIEAGFFNQQNLIVSGLAVTDIRSVIKSVVIGSSDFAAIAQRTFLIAAGSELPVKAVALNGAELQMDVIAAPQANISSIAELRGKTVAVGAGSEAYPILMRLLNLNGMQQQDITVRFLSGPELVTVFEQKLADAMIETRHYTEVLVRKEQAKMLMSYEQIVGALGTSSPQALVVRDDLIKDDPELVQRFVNGWAKALLYINQKPEEAARLLAIYFHRQGVVVRNEDAMKWVSYLKFNRVAWSPADVADAEFNGWGLVEGKIIKNSPKVAGFVDNRFAQKAYAALQ